MNTLNEKDRQELSMLLPWYANGTLDAEDSRKVEEALALDADLAREFDLVLEDQAAVVDLVSEEEVPVSISERFKAALHAELDQHTTDTGPQVAAEPLFSRILATLFPAKPRAYAFATAMFVLLLPAVAMLAYNKGSQQSGGQYQTATGGTEVATDTARMLVKFTSNATLPQIEAFLREHRGQIAKGPTADGLYELSFEKADNLADTLGAKTDLFEFALPVN